MQCRLIAPEEACYIWGTIQQYLERPHKRMKLDIYYDLSDIKTFCMMGDMQLWIALDDNMVPIGAGVTEVTQYPKNKIVKVLLCGSNDGIDFWDTIMNDVAVWAKDIGCICVEIGGRKGWLNRLTNLVDMGMMARRMT